MESDLETKILIYDNSLQGKLSHVGSIMTVYVKTVSHWTLYHKLLGENDNFVGNCKTVVVRMDGKPLLMTTNYCWNEKERLPLIGREREVSQLA